MIFIDSNIPMYLVGTEHPPKKSTARRLLESCINRNERLVTSAEVLQEILHRYVAISRRDAIQPAFDALLNVVDQVYSVKTTRRRARKDAVAGSNRHFCSRGPARCGHAAL